MCIFKLTDFTVTKINVWIEYEPSREKSDTNRKEVRQVLLGEQDTRYTPSDNSPHFPLWKGVKP